MTHLHATMMFAPDICVHCADYLTKVVVAGKSSKEIKVSTIMTPEHVLKTVAPSDTVLAAMELMIDNNFRHVPVVSDPSLLLLLPARCQVSQTDGIRHRTAGG